MTSFQQNCSLLWNTKSREGILIDPGGEAEKLIEILHKENITIKAIWLTHGHLDHIGAAHELRCQLDVPIIGPHKDDKFLFDAIPVQCEMFGFKMIEPFEPDAWLEHGQILRLDEDEFEVLHTPGHTPGHVVLNNRKHKLLWVGDVLFHNSIGRTDFPRGNHEQLISSINSQLLTLEDDYCFIPGHGPESTIGYERTHNPYIS